ncbi:MAG: hypothetical protein ABSH11_12370 [Verrucomicrobiota bacterium]|jgi:hypothetical protein
MAPECIQPNPNPVILAGLNLKPFVQHKPLFPGQIVQIVQVFQGKLFYGGGVSAPSECLLLPVESTAPGRNRPQAKKLQAGGEFFALNRLAHLSPQLNGSSRYGDGWLVGQVTERQLFVPLNFHRHKISPETFPSLWGVHPIYLFTTIEWPDQAARRPQNGTSAENECGAAKGGDRKPAEQEYHVRPALRLVQTL